MSIFRGFLFATVALFPLTAALGDDAPVKNPPAKNTAAQKSEPAPRESVSVSAMRPSVQVLPDRTVYSLDKTIQSATGSVSDILRNLPSVDVDIQGNVALRGDANVTILIDGKQSPLLAGNRADALQQIPANMIERVEVVTNPSAEYRAEGSAGIINIILRKDKEMVASGIVRMNVGNEGRLNGSVSGNVKLGPVRLNMAYGERRDRQSFTSSNVRTDGTNPRSSSDAAGKSIYAGRYLWLGATLDLNARDQIVAGGSYNGFAGHSDSNTRNISVPDASDVTRNAHSGWANEGAQAMLSYRHKFAAKDEEFNLDASRFTSWNRNFSDTVDLITANGQSDYWQSRQATGRQIHSELKAGYSLPLDDKGKFKIGYNLQDDDSLNDSRGQWHDLVTTAWTNDTGYTNAFTIDRTIHAGYVSYEHHFGRFGILGGLRVEQDFLHTDLKTTGETYDGDTLGFYPSTHLSYALSDTQTLKLSYSRRLNRPNINNLNPARFTNDSFNVWAGNPRLKPEQTDSFEASYHNIGEKSDFVVTGYYRATYQGITSVFRYLSPTVVLTTMDNLAHRMASGAEVNINQNLLESLTLRSTASLSYNEVNPGPLSVGAKQSGMNWTLKGGLDWAITADDLMQFNANYAGKQRVAQGYRDPSYTGDLSFKHKFEGGLAGLFTINNLFDSWDRGSVLSSPGLYERAHGTQPGRIFFVGLTYTFGGAKDVERPGENNDNAMPNGAPGTGP